MTGQWIALDSFRVDLALLARKRLDVQYAGELAKMWDEVSKVPIRVWQTPEGLVASDGAHRVTAAKQRGETKILAEIFTGTREDAEADALAANQRHGRTLTPEEREDAVVRMRKLFPDATPVQLSKKLLLSEFYCREILDRHTIQEEVDTTGLANATVEQIGRAPKWAQPSLVEAAKKRGWTHREARTAAQQVSSEKFPEDYKSELLRGEADPVAERPVVGDVDKADREAAEFLSAWARMIQAARIVGHRVMTSGIPEEFDDRVRREMLEKAVDVAAIIRDVQLEIEAGLGARVA